MTRRRAAVVRFFFKPLALVVLLVLVAVVFRLVAGFFLAVVFLAPVFLTAMATFPSIKLLTIFA